MNIKKELGTKIKRLRQKRGYTQEQLAEKIGIATRTLSGIEIGENFVTAETLEKFFATLDVSSTELFSIDHLKPKEDLVNELIKDLQNLHDRDKIETIYKIVKATIND